MLSKPQPEFFRGLVITTRQPGWVPVKQGLEAELQALYERMRDTRDDVDLRQLQGRAQALKDFLAIADAAPQLLDKLMQGRK